MGGFIKQAVREVIGGTGINVDSTNKTAPIINATGGDGGNGGLVCYGKLGLLSDYTGDYPVEPFIFTDIQIDEGGCVDAGNFVVPQNVNYARFSFQFIFASATTPSGILVQLIKNGSTGDGEQRIVVNRGSGGYSDNIVAFCGGLIQVTAGDTFSLRVNKSNPGDILTTYTFFTMEGYNYAIP